MKYTTMLQLDHDNWLQKLIIGIRLAFNQDQLIGVFSHIQHIDSLIDTKDAFDTDELLSDIQEQARSANKTFEELFDGM
jgi:hypothetical protein